MTIPLTSYSALPTAVYWMCTGDIRTAYESYRRKFGVEPGVVFLLPANRTLTQVYCMAIPDVKHD